MDVEMRPDLNVSVRKCPRAKAYQLGHGSDIALTTAFVLGGAR
jgi:hypothetical protein